MKYSYINKMYARGNFWKKEEVEMPKTAFAEIINLASSKSDLSNRTQHVV